MSKHRRSNQSIRCPKDLRFHAGMPPNPSKNWTSFVNFLLCPNLLYILCRFKIQKSKVNIIQDTQRLIPGPTWLLTSTKLGFGELIFNFSQICILRQNGSNKMQVKTLELLLFFIVLPLLFRIILASNLFINFSLSNNFYSFTSSGFNFLDGSPGANPQIQAQELCCKQEGKTFSVGA